MATGLFRTERREGEGQTGKSGVGGRRKHDRTVLCIDNRCRPWWVEEMLILPRFIKNNYGRQFDKELMSRNNVLQFAVLLIQCRGLTELVGGAKGALRPSSSARLAFESRGRQPSVCFALAPPDDGRSGFLIPIVFTDVCDCVQH